MKATTEQLWSGGRGWILVAVSLGWALSIGVRFVYPTLVPFFRSAFRIDLATTGLLLTVLWGAYALGHVPGGILGDRLGEGNILVLSTVLSAGAVLAVATSINVEMLFAGTTLYGVATALYGPTRVTIFTNIYSERAGSAIGLTMATGSLANATFPVAAAFIATYATWRVSLGVFVPLFLVAAVAVWVLVPGRTSGATSAVDELSSDSLERIKSGITHGSIMTVVAIQVCLSFTVQGVSSFYPAYLTATKDLSPETAAILFGVFFGVGSLLQPFSGTMVGRFGTRATLAGFLLGSALPLWLLPFVSGFVQLAALTVLLSSLTACLVITQSYVAATLPDDMQGTGMGVLKAGWMILGATSPLIVGTVADFGYFDGAFLMLAGVISIGLLLTVVRL